MSPKQYLIQLRMNRALELLTKNEISVKEISFACGFTDEKYFSRAFKKRYGYPPSQLKNNMII
ncbi:MAG: helix-turn-helix transcriptional regulator [Lachnospiraceae bacterium]|nr:helix-turn-helix transcriptional regulator [Lachnospiraceae bacterium]